MPSRFITIPGFKGGLANSLFDPLSKQTYQTARNLDVFSEENILTPLNILSAVTPPADGDNDFAPENFIKGSDGSYHFIGRITISSINNLTLYSTGSLLASPTWKQDFRAPTGASLGGGIEEYKDRVFWGYGTIIKAIGLLTGTNPTFTVTIASPAVFTKTGHGFAVGDAVRFSTTGALPTGLTAGTVYYVSSFAADIFEVSTTPGGSAVNTSGSQSGVHTISKSTKTITSGLTGGLDFLRENKGLGLLFFIHNSGKLIGKYDNTTVTLNSLTLERDDTAVGIEPWGRFNIIGVRSSAKKDRFLVWDGSATTIDDATPTGDMGLQAFRVLGSTIHFLTANITTGGQFFRYYTMSVGGKPKLIKEFKVGTTTGNTTVNPQALDFIGDKFQFAFNGATYSLLDQVIWAYGSGGKDLPDLLTPYRTTANGATTDRIFIAIKNLPEGLVIIWRNSAATRPYNIERTGISTNPSDDGVYESNAFPLNSGLKGKINKIYINHKPIPASTGFTVAVRHYGNYPWGTSVPAQEAYQDITGPQGSGSSTGKTQSTDNAAFTELTSEKFVEARYGQIRVSFDEISGITAPSIIFPIIIEVE